jgi:hypothetical protein
MHFSSFLLPFFLLFATLVEGQNTLDSAKTDVYPSQIYQKSRLMPWALKFEANSIMRDNAYFFNRFGLISEHRLAKNISLNITARLYRESRLLFQDALAEGEKKAGWQQAYSIEPRWYLSKNPNTFFGNYMGLRLLRETGFRRPETAYKMLVAFGTQRLYYTSMFNNIDNAFDGSLSLGLSYQKSKGFRPAFQIQMLQGPILNDFFRKYKPENAPPNRKNEYQAMHDQNYHLKFDLFNLVTKADENDIVGELHLSYEQKIAKSPFSINFDVSLSPSRFKNADILMAHPDSIGRGAKNVERSIGNRLGLSLESRWYYDLKKRMANNTSGNNLLGNYLSFEFLYQNQVVQKRHFDASLFKYKAENLTFTPIWGSQQQFSKRVFYDFKLGWGLRTLKDASNTYFKKFESNIYADILIGLRFGD